MTDGREDAMGAGGPAGTGSGGSAGTGSGTGGGTGQEGGSRLSDGVRQGLGVLSAFKDALEETIRDSRDRGELSSDRAREVIQSAMSRAKEAAGEARERLDFAPRQEIDDLREAVDELKVRLENLERRTSQAPDVGPTRSSSPE